MASSLLGLDGVVSAETNYVSGCVHVVYDPSKVDMEAVREAIARAATAPSNERRRR